MGRDGSVYIISGNIIFAAIAMVALLLGGWTSVAALTVCAAYFTISTMMFLLTATGGLRDVLVVAVEHGSRLLELSMLMRWKWRVLRESGGVSAGKTPAARSMPVIDDVEISAPMLGGRTFVSPLDANAVRTEAYAWLASLFDTETGFPDEHKVHMVSASGSAGWLKVRAPIGAARDVLLRDDVLLRRQNGFALNLARVSHLEDIGTAAR